MAFLPRFFVIIVIIVAAMGVIVRVWSNANEPWVQTDISSRSTNSPLTVPFSFNRPEGWGIAEFSGGANAIKYGGPTNGISMWPDNGNGQHDPDELFGRPTMSFTWYHYNPEADLKDIFGVQTGTKSILDSGDTTVADRPSYFVVFDGQATPEPYYRAEEYHVRLNRQTILDINILFPTEDIYQRYVVTTNAMLASIRFQTE